jgi:hypothetical protein
MSSSEVLFASIAILIRLRPLQKKCCEGDHKRSRKHSSFYIRSHDFQHLVH